MIKRLDVWKIRYLNVIATCVIILNATLNLAADTQETGTKFADSSKNLLKGDIFKKGVGIPAEDKTKSTDKANLYSEGDIGVNIITVSPEVATLVEMSSSDMNRIQCLTDIRDVVFSKEKGVTVKIIGKNAFVKFMVAKRGDKESYSSTPTEIFVACDESIYNLIALPKRIPSQTVRLNMGINKIKKNASLYEGMPLEKKIVSIIKSIYTDEMPDSFTIEQVGRKMDIFKDVDMSLQRIVSVDGEGILVKEYRAVLKGNSEKDIIEIREKDFLRAELTTKPVSIMVDRLKLKKGDTVKVLIVESAGRASERAN